MSAVLATVVEAGLGAAGNVSEEVLETNTDAALSVRWAEQRWIGRLLSTKYNELARQRASDAEDHDFRASSWVSYALQALCVGYGSSSALAIPNAMADSAGMDEPNELLYVAAALIGLGVTALGLTIPSASAALRPGGALEELGVGKEMISAEDAHSNARWRKGLLALSSLWVLFGLYFIAASVLELPPYAGDGSAMQLRILLAVNGLYFCTVLPIATSAWWASMRTGSCLCRDKTIEVIKAIDSTDPTSEGWDAAVAKPALELREKFELLSDGWQGGLLGLGAFCWLWVLAGFANAINAELCVALDTAQGNSPGSYRASQLTVMAICFPPPLLLAVDVAHTSSWCDTLVERLNEARAKFGPEADEKITWLETTLLRLVCLPFQSFPQVFSNRCCAQNKNQGLGFQLGPIVIDTQYLKRLAAQLMTGGALVYGYLLALANPSTGHDQCGLTAVQTAMIQAAMVERNSSCVLNMTLASILNSEVERHLRSGV
eukprot:COSAG06_NODE_9981_length_1775_cov_1.859189_1_plen_491_part_00